MHENVPVTAAYVTPNASLTAAHAFQHALAVTAGAPMFHDRVSAAKISIYYVMLLRWEEMYNFAGKHSIPWPLETSKQEAWAEFERVWNKVGIRSEREGLCNITCFKAQVFPPSTF